MLCITIGNERLKSFIFLFKLYSIIRMKFKFIRNFYGNQLTYNEMFLIVFVNCLKEHFYNSLYNIRILYDK